MSWIIKRSGKFIAGYRNNGQTGYSKAFDTEEEAKNYQPLPLNPTNTVGFLFNQYLEVSKRSLSPRTIEIIKHSLSPYLKTYKNRILSTLTTHEHQQFRDKLLQSKASNGANITIRNIKTFLNFGVRNGYLTANPALGLKQFKIKKVARFLNRGEIAAIYKVSPKKLRRTYYTLIYTGLRLGEYLNLDTTKVYNDYFLIENTKTGTPRMVPILERGRKVILSSIGIWKRDGLEQAHRVAVKRANLGRIRLHDFRHTFASFYLQSGGTISDLQKILGHKSLNATSIYTHFQPSYLIERVSKMRLVSQTRKLHIPIITVEERCVSGLNGSPGKNNSKYDFDDILP